MKKLYIIFSGRFPSEKAAALFVAENARSLSARYSVSIIVPVRREVTDTAHSVYSLPENVDVVYLPTINLFGISFLAPLAFYIHQLVFSWQVYRYLRLHGGKSLAIANDLLPGLAVEAAGMKLLYEVHDFPERLVKMYRLLFRHALLVLATNQWKFDRLTQLFPEVSKKITMERNGVDLGVFSASLQKEDARKKLSLEGVGHIALYTGHLYSWKGVDTFADAASLMPEVTCVCVGGTKEDIARYTATYAKITNLRFVGHVPHTQIPLWQAAADVLVLPNTAKEAIAVHYTSPMKLFEYMASGRPIVASSLPSIRELLDENTAYLVVPDDAASLAQTVQGVLSDYTTASFRAVGAQARVAEYSWEKRANRLYEALEQFSGL